jgi:2-oxoglutarate dehydrogenase E2 component (dihydrolipoamide succinyltransferase)
VEIRQEKGVKMPSEIVVPELGESVLEATVSRWFKQEGDNVSVGETLVELETDKVNLEVGARESGVLARIERQDGEDVKVGDILGVIETVEEGEPPPKAGRDGEGKEEHKEEIQKEEQKEEAKDEEKPQEEGDRKAAQVEEHDERVTPVAARLAREHGLDLSQVAGSGPGGRITKGDVETLIAERPSERNGEKGKPTPEKEAEAQEGRPAEKKPQKPAPSEKPVQDGRREERIRMSRRRRTIAHRLVEAQQTAAMLTTFNEIDMSAVMALRARRNESFTERYGVKLGFTSFFVKASIGALKAFPKLNAEIQGDEMVLKHYYDIGVAIGDPQGLVVPVLRNADQMTFAAIEQQVKDLANRAQEGALTLEDLRGGTFTITNGGVFGSLLSTPILSYPQVGILGLHKIEKRPIAVDDEMVIRPMMYVALSYDHRIVDGREAVQFLVRVKELVEDPETLLIEG